MDTLPITGGRRGGKINRITSPDSFALFTAFLLHAEWYIEVARSSRNLLVSEGILFTRGRWRGRGSRRGLSLHVYGCRGGMAREVRDSLAL